MADRLTAEYWRNRAENTRARAGETAHPTSRAALLRFAEIFELLAKRAEEKERLN